MKNAGNTLRDVGPRIKISSSAHMDINSRRISVTQEFGKGGIVTVDYERNMHKILKTDESSIGAKPFAISTVRVDRLNATLILRSSCALNLVNSL